MRPRLIKTTNELSLTVVFAALYAAGVAVLAPISFSFFQVRVADSLLPLAILFGWPAIIGISLGTIVCNFFGGLGIIDVIGGTAANLVATFLAWKIGQRKIKGSWPVAIAVQIAVVTLIVGSYLSYLFQIPLLLGMLGVLVGSAIAIGILGYIILTVLTRTHILNLDAHTNMRSNNTD